MRILLTVDPEIPVPPSTYGGIERVVALLATGLEQRGQTRDLFGEMPEQLEAQGLKYERTISKLDKKGNVVGLMPHPEHAVEPLTGPTTDGLGFFTSVLTSLVNR